MGGGIIIEGRIDVGWGGIGVVVMVGIIVIVGSR